MSEQQELEPVLNELIDKAKSNFWSRDHVERDDNRFEAYNNLMAAGFAMDQYPNIDAVAQLPSVLLQTRIHAVDIEWDGFFESLRDNFNWEDLCRQVIKEVIAAELLLDPLIAAEDNRRYDRANI